MAAVPVAAAVAAAAAVARSCTKRGVHTLRASRLLRQSAVGAVPALTAADALEVLGHHVLLLQHREDQWQVSDFNFPHFIVSFYCTTKYFTNLMRYNNLMNIFKPIFCDSISIVFFQSPTLFAAPKLSGKLGGNSGPRPSVKLGSWNIKHLSLAKINGTNRYGTKHTLPLLAKHLAAFDVCAIQEVNFRSFCSKYLLDKHHGGMRIVHPSASALSSFPPTFVRLN